MTRLTAKGEARRSAVAQAAARVVATDGLDALSHRAVAAASGLPLAATTYYFDDLESLRVAAVARLVDDETARVESLVAELPRRRRSAAATAAVVVDVVLGPLRRSDEELHSLYERFLACGRHPSLRPVMRAARARIDTALGEAVARCGRPRADVGTLVALIDGSVISALVEGDGSARSRAEEAVGAVLDRSAGPAPLPSGGRTGRRR
jgi:DNA-binding transcriptional regulator YbjK